MERMDVEFALIVAGLNSISVHIEDFSNSHRKWRG